MDLYSRQRPGLGGAVQLWLLQHDADLPFAGADRDGPLQAQDLVRLLSHGDYDPGDLQAEEPWEGRLMTGAAWRFDAEPTRMWAG